MECSTLNVDFNSVRLDLLCSRSPPYERIKFGYPKIWVLSDFFAILGCDAHLVNFR